MRHYGYKLSALILFLTLMLAEGCSQKELNDNAPTTIADNVTVVFDWSKAPDTQAKSMVLYLFSDQHDVMNYWFNNREGGLIKSYGGQHTAVCHSNDDPYVHHLRNQSTHNGIEIFTDNTTTLVGQGISARGLPRAEGTESEPLRATPTMIYGDQNKEIDLKVTSFEQTLTFYPEELVCSYEVEFVDVENLKNADLRIDATISSLAGGYYLGKKSPTSEPVSHTFTLTADDEMKTLHSQFYTFGLPDGEERPHKICVYISMKNRTGNFYTFDVSDQVNNAPDPRNVSIKIYGLKLPDIPDDPPDPPQQGGVSVEINSWETYHFDLKV